jgi:hypothetical protein
MGDLIRVEVQRSKWLRGKGTGKLRNSCGLQCCLGFVAVAAGFTEAEIENQNLVSELCDSSPDPREVVEHALLRSLVHIDVCDDDEDYEGELVSVGGTELEDNLVNINDTEAINDAEREEQLAVLAAKAGIEFVFVD